MDESVLVLVTLVLVTPMLVMLVLVMRVLILDVTDFVLLQEQVEAVTVMIFFKVTVLGTEIVR